MDQNEFLNHSFLVPQGYNHYRLPTTELKSLTANIQSQPSLYRTLQDQQKLSLEPPQNSKHPITVKHKRKNDLFNSPLTVDKKRNLFPDLFSKQQLRKEDKIEHQRPVKGCKNRRNKIILRHSITEAKDDLSKYLSQKKRERKPDDSRSVLRSKRIESESAEIQKVSHISHFLYDSRVQSRINNDKTEKEDIITFISLRTQFYYDRCTLWDLYTSGRRENKLIGQYEAKIPKIPPRDQLSKFIVNYKPHNPEINLPALLKINFCAVEYSQDELYIGQMIGKHKNGLGIYITSKNCFEGLWKQNQKVRGLQITKNGTYKGHYVLNKREGQGEFLKYTGDSYVGEWKAGKKHGQGLWINQNGQSYNGQWVNGKAEGIGTLTLKSRHYKGAFVAFRQNGFGKQKFSNGDYFEGMFREDLPCGSGKYFWKNGSMFEGNFMNGQREGHGQLRTKSQMVYKGLFTNDKPAGECEIVIRNKETCKGYVTQKSEGKSKNKIYTVSIKHDRLPSNKAIIFSPKRDLV